MRGVYAISLLIIMTFFSGCIHEYPKGEVIIPDDIEFGIELDLDLEWKQYATQLDLKSRASYDSPHRIIIEVEKGSDVLGRDIIYLSDEDFSEGTVTHKLSFNLKPTEYKIGIWYDYCREWEEETYYNAADLSNVSQIQNVIKWDTKMHCGYASEYIDLRKYNGQPNVRLLKKMELKHPGARFELVATDVTDFLAYQDPLIQLGETYTITLEFSQIVPATFNVFEGYAIEGADRSLTDGPLTIPFGRYEQLSIASGFIFCDEEMTIEMRIAVHNSARVPIIQSQWFDFKIRPGTLTRVFAQFLSERVESTFIIDNIWAGEIFIDI